MDVHQDILEECFKISEELSKKEKNCIIKICNKLDFSDKCIKYISSKNLYNKERLNRCIPSVALDVVNNIIDKKDAENIMLLNCILHYGLKHKNIDTKYAYKLIYLNDAINNIKINENKE